MPNFWDADLPANSWSLDPVVNPSATENPAQADIVKQAGAGLTEFLAGIPGAAPTTYKQIGSAVSALTGLPTPQPIINAPTPLPQQITAGLPAPQGAAQQAARNLAPFAMSAFQPGHVGENLAGGIGAAGGSYLGSQFGPTFGMTPEEGSLAGAVVGGFAGARTAGNKLNDIRRGNLPSPQEVIDETGASYDALRRANRSIVVPPDTMRLAKNSALNLLRQNGPAEEDAKAVYSIIKGLDDENGGTVADLINARKNLHSHLHSMEPNANVPAAIDMSDLFDRFISKMAVPGTMAELQRNDKNWGAARTAQAVDTKITQAEDRAEGANSGMNAGNNIIQNINAYIKSKTNKVTGQVYLNPSDLEQLNQVRNLDTAQKATRMLSGAAGGGGGRDITAAAILGMGSAFGANQAGANVTEGSDPLIAGAAVPALGLLGRYGFNRSVARAAKNAEASILARAPYVQSAGGAAPQPLLSFPQVAGRSLLFAAPALKNSLFSQGAQ